MYAYEYSRIFIPWVIPRTREFSLLVAVCQAACPDVMLLPIEYRITASFGGSFPFLSLLFFLFLPFSLKPTRFVQIIDFAIVINRRRFRIAVLLAESVRLPSLFGLLNCRKSKIGTCEVLKIYNDQRNIQDKLERKKEKKKKHYSWHSIIFI